MGTASGPDEPARSLAGPAADPTAPPQSTDEAVDPALRQAIETAEALAAKAERVLPEANAEDADELRAMLDDLRAAVESEIGGRHPEHQRGRRPGLLPGGRVTSRPIAYESPKVSIT